MSATAANNFHLVLDNDERSELEELLREALSETRVEMRHTDSPAYQEKVHKEEVILRRLLEKVQALRA